MIISHGAVGEPRVVGIAEATMLAPVTPCIHRREAASKPSSYFKEAVVTKTEEKVL
jgi:hypothetical protein